MEKDLIQSNNKVNELSDIVTILQLKLKDIDEKLECSNTKCDKLLIDNENLHYTVDRKDLQVYYLKIWFTNNINVF